MSSNGWKEFSIGEVCTLGDGAHTKVKRLDTGVLYLTSKNIKDGKLILNDVSYISKEDFNRLFSSSQNSVRNLQYTSLKALLSVIIVPFNYPKINLYASAKLAASSVTPIPPLRKYSATVPPMITIPTTVLQNA